MHVVKAAVLGIIQGLTEFLPISSSGHLILAREGLRWELLADVHLNKMFDVAVHTGTLISLVAYFGPDIARLGRAFFASLRSGIAGDPTRRMAWLIVVGTIPAALAGAAGQDIIEQKLGAPLLVASLLIVFGLILWLAEWRGAKTRDLDDLGWWDGILVGVAQAVALAPGVSRSGITMTAGLARGAKRETAARFSFLLSIPIIAGTAAYGFVSLARHSAALPPGALGVFLAGMAAAAASGYLCIRLFLRYLVRRGLLPFILYRLALGLVLVVWFARLT